MRAVLRNVSYEIIILVLFFVINSAYVISRTSNDEIMLIMNIFGMFHSS